MRINGLDSEMDFYMSRYTPHVFSLVSLALVTGIASAAAPQEFDIKLVNESGEHLSLNKASWPFGKFEADDYAIPMHHAGKFRLAVSDDKKGRVSFEYTTGDKACSFSGGLDQKRVAGWLIYDFETYSWARAKSSGSFRADCKAAIKKKVWGKGYDLKFTIK
jgi:hypothetical protein